MRSTRQGLKDDQLPTKPRLERQSAFARNDFVLLGRQNERLNRDIRCVPEGIEFIAEKPSHGQIGKLARGWVTQTVEGGDQNESLNRSAAGDIDRHTASQASAQHGNMRMLRMHLVKKSEGIGE